jgi:hypothetical protein
MPAAASGALISLDLTSPTLYSLARQYVACDERRRAYSPDLVLSRLGKRIFLAH